jgi:carboxylesterase
MNKNDFRYMRRGKQLADLSADDFALLQPIEQRGQKMERALILLHGFSSSPAVYRYLLPQLKNYDAIVCPTLPGHGLSMDAFAQSKAADWLSATQAICADLCQQYRKVDIVGLSLGGLIACKLSERFDFNHIFLLAPALKLKMNVARNLKLARFLQCLGFKEIRGAAGNLLGDAHAEISYKRLAIATVMEMLDLVLTHQWVAPKAPVDLFLGAQDEVVASPQIEELFRNLPNVNIHWLSNSAHVLPLDNDLEQIIDCINAC